MSQPVYAHFEGKPSGHVNVNDLLKPNRDITFLEKIGIYFVDGLLIILALALISMLIRRKKIGKILVFFLIVLIIDCFIVLHYGSAFDLLG